MDLRLIIAAVAALALSGCATSPIQLGLPCNVGPIHLSPGASTRLTTREKQDVVTVNESGATFCGWKPPRK